jgi:hypothetical protein
LGYNLFHSIAIEILRAQEPLLLPLAQMLKERHGAAVHLYVRSPEDARGLFRRNGAGVWDSVANGHILPQALRAEGVDEAVEVERARKLATATGEPINRFALADRLTGQSFVTGAVNHPLAPYARSATNAQLLHAINEQADFWAREIKDKKLTLLIDGNKFMAAMGRDAGVPYRRLTLARYKTYYYWASDEFFAYPALKDVYDSLKEWPEADIKGVYAVAADKYVTSAHDNSWTRLFSQMPVNILRHLYYQFRDYEKGRAFSLRDVALNPIRIHRAARRLNRLATETLASFEGMDFVYFPLQKDPEVAIMQSAPECLDQFAAIVSIARDLPAGVKLAVKENPSAIGRRATAFYDQIAGLKNVALLNLDTPSIAAIKQAKATVTIAGTASMEAAILGKPSLTFSPHVKWAFLSHVRIIKSESHLAALLDWAVNGPFDEEQARADGSRFAEALAQASMDMSGFRRDEKKRTHVRDENIETVYQGLCVSLGIEPVAGKKKEAA